MDTKITPTEKPPHPNEIAELSATAIKIILHLQNEYKRSYETLQHNNERQACTLDEVKSEIDSSWSIRKNAQTSINQPPDLGRGKNEKWKNDVINDFYEIRHRELLKRKQTNTSSNVVTSHYFSKKTKKSNNFITDATIKY